MIGAGGIGVDVSHFLTHDPADGFDDWMAHWGVGDPAVHPGGLTERKPRTPVRDVTLLQRKTTPIGAGLGKTSGWAHRAVLKQSGVVQVNGVAYDRVDDAGLHVTVDGEPRVYDVDHVVLCAGQESVRGVYDDLVAAGRAVDPHLIGGADVAAELDAKRAIEQGTRVAGGPLIPAGRPSRWSPVVVPRSGRGARFTRVIVDLSDEEARAALPLKWGAVEPGWCRPGWRRWTTRWRRRSWTR